MDYISPPPPQSNQVYQPVPQFNPDDKLARLKQVATKYELAGGSILKLRNLDKFDIVIIVDDSSSMNITAHPAKSAYEKAPSRWEELCYRIEEIVEIATCIDPDGIDLYFLNSDPIKNVTDPSVVRNIFFHTKRPNGYTPLTACYEHVLQDKNIDERPILIIIATDGEPNRQNYDGTWVKDIVGFERAVSKRKSPEKSPTTILACTDDQSQISWMNRLDNAPFVNILDDYQSEKQEILLKQGKDFHFTGGDYIVAAMLGCIDPIYDGLDEKRLTNNQYAEYMGNKGRDVRKKDCCTIS